MSSALEDFFKSETAARDKHLSRLFGLFSERIVHDWCSCSQAPYVNLGRPTLWAPGDKRSSTLDFTLRRRATGQTYFAEMKCRPEFENYHYLRLIGPDQITRIKEPVAFVRFLQMATNPAAYQVHVDGQPTEVEGAILVWSVVTDERRAAAMAQLGLADVLSVESLLSDLHSWGSTSWTDYVRQLKQ